MFSSAYIKGHSHLKCDDYALHGQNCAFLSDGCSAVFNSDIGAKILPYMAIKYLYFNTQDQIHQYLTFLGAILNKEFDKNIFACTLGGIIKNLCMSQFFLLGDGIVYIELEDDNKYLYKVSYSQNIPFYFQYYINEDEKILWGEFKENKKIVELYNFQTNITKILQHENDKLIFNGYIRKDMRLVTIFSDGPEQVDNSELPNVIHELTDFKNFNPDFAWRRLKRFEETKRKEGKFCQDDISMIVYKRD